MTNDTSTRNTARLRRPRRNRPATPRAGRATPGLCYACKTEPAVGQSAYCAGCQPVSPSLPPGNVSHCAKCGQTFGTMTDFDRHHTTAYDTPAPVRCAHPATLGLVDNNGVWRTPEGAANRARLADRLAALRAA